MRWMLGLALLAAQSAQAQISWETYGRFDVSLTRPGNRLDAEGDAVEPDTIILTSGSRNRVGLRGLHEAGGARRVRLTLEQSLFGQPGQPYLYAGPWRNVRPFDAVALVSISHYAYGRLDIGRRTDVVTDVPASVHPWAGETIASDNCASSLNWPCPSRLNRPIGLTYESPSYDERWTWSGQLAARKGKGALSTRLVYAAGGRRFDGGLRLIDKDNWLLPLGWVEPVGTGRLHALWTTGRTNGVHADYGFIGATRGWRGGELRLGAGWYRMGPLRKHAHWSAGLHSPVQADLIVYSNLAWHRDREGNRGAQVDLGVKATF